MALSDNLIHYYDGETDFTDLVGSRDGSTGSTLTAGINGNGRDFSNTTGTFPDNTFQATMTLSFWINPDSGASTGMIFYESKNEGGDGFGAQDEMHVHVRDNVGNYNVAFRASSNNVDNISNGALETTSGLTPGTWNNVVLTIDSNTTASLYLNGSLEDSITINGNIDFSVFTTHRIGTPDATNRRLNAQIDEIGIWDRVLSSSEITQLASESFYPGFVSIINFTKVNPRPLPRIPVGTNDVVFTYVPGVNINLLQQFAHSNTNLVDLNTSLCLLSEALFDNAADYGGGTTTTIPTTYPESTYEEVQRISNTRKTALNNTFSSVDTDLITTESIINDIGSSLEDEFSNLQR